MELNRQNCDFATQLEDSRKKNAGWTHTKLERVFKQVVPHR